MYSVRCILHTGTFSDSLTVRALVIFCSQWKSIQFNFIITISTKPTEIWRFNETNASLTKMRYRMPKGENKHSKSNILYDHKTLFYSEFQQSTLGNRWR